MSALKIFNDFDKNRNNEELAKKMIYIPVTYLANLFWANFDRFFENSEYGGHLFNDIIELCILKHSSNPSQWFVDFFTALVNAPNRRNCRDLDEAFADALGQLEEFKYEFPSTPYLLQFKFSDEQLKILYVLCEKYKMKYMQQCIDKHGVAEEEDFSCWADEDPYDL